jgi:hypothetical protein
MTFSPASSFCLSWTNSSLSFNDRFDRRHRAFPFYATQRSHQACNRSVFTSACDICWIGRGMVFRSVEGNLDASQRFGTCGESRSCRSNSKKGNGAEVGAGTASNKCRRFATWRIACRGLDNSCAQSKLSVA